VAVVGQPAGCASVGIAIGRTPTPLAPWMAAVLAVQLRRDGWYLNDEALEASGVAGAAAHGGTQAVQRALLDADLRVVGSAVLPTGKVQRFTLRGTFVVQLVSQADVSVPQEMDTGRAGGSSRRLLRLKLTDGHRVVFAAEYHPIKELHADMLPGANN
jgi:hypothetical protein